mgnify:CR=1 FL=1
MTDTEKIDALVELLNNVMHTLNLKQYYIDDPTESHQCEVQADAYHQQMIDILHSNSWTKSSTLPSFQSHLFYWSLLPSVTPAPTPIMQTTSNMNVTNWIADYDAETIYGYYEEITDYFTNRVYTEVLEKYHNPLDSNIENV